MSTVVIVGASVGGVRTAQALRSAGFDGRVVLVGREPELPYDKPPLSKRFLAGEVDEEGVALLTQDAADAAGIELRLGVAAEHLDVAGRTLTLADGTEFAWDAAVIATGADARRSPWAATSGVHVIRTLEDSRTLRADFAAGGPVVVVGGGFIGAEVAATAHAAGHEVTVVDPLPVPIGRVLGEEVGARFADVHYRHGVTTRFGVGVDAVAGSLGDLRVTLTDGEVLIAAVVVVGIGAVPNDGWLASSGLEVANGVVCDEHGRAAPGVYAVGDVARWFDSARGEHVRVEHWTSATEQAGAVAHTITHPEDPRTHQGTGYVWSDQYDWKIQLVGRPGAAPEHRVVGDFDASPPRAAALYTDETGRLLGAVTVNWPKALVLCRKVLAGGGSADEAGAALVALPPPRPAA